jgi:hypothetical protein
LPWDEDRRRAPSTSKANSQENVTKQRYPSGSGDPATDTIARAFGDPSTEAGRARLRLAGWKDNPELEALAERSKDPTCDEKLSPQQRIQLGLFLDEKRKVAEARGRWGGDAA